MTKQVVAIDLDGTLIMGNTFRDYLSFCGRRALSCYRFDICFVIMLMVLLRKIRLVSHGLMKKVLLSKTSAFFRQRKLLDSFLEEEFEKINPKVLAQIETFRNQGFALALVTAAPVSYAQEMAVRQRFDACMATPLPDAQPQRMWQENKGEKKVEVLRQWMEAEGLQLSAVITDHTDDLPLAKYSQGKVFLCSTQPSVTRVYKQQLGNRLEII